MAAAMFTAFSLHATPAVAQLEVETDPVAFALHGYSLELAVADDQRRLRVGAFGWRTPESDDPSGRVPTRVPWGLSATYGYFLDSSQSGIFVGATSRYLQRESLSGPVVEARQFSLGPELGYRFTFPRSRFFVTPSVSFMVIRAGRRIAASGKSAESEAVTATPALHLGWCF